MDTIKSGYLYRDEVPVAHVEAFAPDHQTARHAVERFADTDRTCVQLTGTIFATRDAAGVISFYSTLPGGRAAFCGCTLCMPKG